MNPHLDTALGAIKKAREIILAFYRDSLQVEYKADASPVTEADRAAEIAIREHLLAAFPEHGIFGEEHGWVGDDSEYLWLIDPIDGTKSFVAGYGFFSTQLALMHRGELVLGVSSAPAMNELAWAEIGAGAWLNHDALKVSEVTRIEDAHISTGNIQSLAASPSWPALGAILARCNKTRGYGDFYHYHRLAAGQLDAVIESNVNILDIAALTVIVREAGGVITDLGGNAIGLETTSILAAPPALHQALLTELSTT